VDHVEVVDQEGHPIDRAELEPVQETDESADTDAAETGEGQQ